jgi:hypothetical protein
MKKGFNLSLVVLGVVLAGCSLWIVATTIFGPYYYWQYRLKQQELAHELNVNFKDYPAPYTFPEGYFVTILTPDMNIEAVHKFVLGYEKVFQCGESEVYYYFSENREDALIFKISYDMDLLGNERRFLSLIGQENSKTIRIDGCVPGLLEE